PTKLEHDMRVIAFKAADMGGKGHLTLKEFQIAMHALEFSYDNEECRAIFHEIDSDENGIIDINEFISQFE
ncbi:MAG: EF-hand domain-containing protein, partial [Candidatus Poseidoniaceae archaeon]|nr:EF-hand domain-containing protein [Candidatus Poseidoniaceae archaeon]